MDREKLEEKLLNIEGEIKYLERQKQESERAYLPFGILLGLLAPIFSDIFFQITKSNIIYYLAGSSTIIIGVIFWLYTSHDGKKFVNSEKKLSKLQLKRKKLKIALKSLTSLSIDRVYPKTRKIICWDCQKEISDQDCLLSLKYCSDCRK